MTFLYPGFLTAAGLVSLGVVILHFLVTQQPRSDILPTVRFIPDMAARSTSVAIRPSDLWLLLLRVLMIMLIGAAFAQPQRKPQHKNVTRLVMVDASRAAADLAEVADSARHYTTGASAVILFDSTAHSVPIASVADSLRMIASRPHSVRHGLFSPALIATLREASRVREGADSLDLILISPFASEERDAATNTIRALWPGRIVPVRVSLASDSTLLKQSASRNVTVQWADSGTNTFWTNRPSPDTAGAVRIGEVVLVYPFARRWRLAASLDSNTHVYARWIDGEPAGIERVSNGACVRSLAFALPTAGDAILRPSFVRFLDALKTPCGVSHDMTPMPPEEVAVLQGPEHLTPVSSVKPRITKENPYIFWLLLAALVLALFELLVRRAGGIRGKAPADTESPEPEARRTTSGRAA